MRRAMLVLTLLVGAFFTIGAAPASAANCTSVHMNPTYYNGALNFDAFVGGCVQVDIVGFGTAAGTGPGSMGGWWDYPYSRVIRAVGTCCQGVDPYGAAFITYGGTPPWCVHQVHGVYTYFWWRIHNSVTHTWGSWVQTQSQAYNIIC